MSLEKGGNLETETHKGRMPCEREVRDWGGPSTSQGMPEVGSKPPDAGREAWDSPSLAPSEGVWPCPHPDLGCPAARSGRDPEVPFSCSIFGALPRPPSRTHPGGKVLVR